MEIADSYDIDVPVEEQAIEQEQMVSELLFVDTSVENYQTLIENLNRNVEVIFIDSDVNGITKITDALEEREDISAVHIISHGNSGEVNLGNAKLTSNNINAYQEQLNNWGDSLTVNADILIYGCNVGMDSEFVEGLSTMTGADVAASDDLTGAEYLGGDETLEVQVGDIEAAEILDEKAYNAAGVKLVANAVDDNFNSTEDQILTVVDGATDLLFNDTGASISVVGFDNVSANGAIVSVNADGSFTYNPAGSTTIQALDEGVMLEDTFTYTITDSGTPPDGQFNVSVFAADSGAGSNDNDLNTTNEVLGIWNAIDGGADLANLVSANGKDYNIARYEQDTENRVIYNGNFDGYTGSLAYNSINSNGAGGSGGSITGGNDFSVRAKSFLYFKNAGTYSIAVGSDDGRRIELTGTAGVTFAGFTAAGGQTTGTNLVTDSSVVMHNNPTGHNHTTGVFTVAAGDILELDTFFYERGGGDQFHLSIKAGSDTSHGGTGDDWQILQSGVEDIILSTDLTSLQTLTTSTATVKVKLTGVNDAPSGVNDSRSVTETADAITDPATSGNVLSNDTDADDPVANFTVTEVNNLAGNVGTTIVGTYGSVVINADGSFTYILDDADADTQALSKGQIVTESFTYTLSDNHSDGAGNNNPKTGTATLTITITGSRDSPVAQDNTADVTEDNSTNDSGNVITDDDGSGFDVSDGPRKNITTINGVTDPSIDVNGTYGTLDWSTDGSYQYNLNNGTNGVASAVQSLAAGQTATDTFTYTLNDRNATGDGLFNISAFAADSGGGSNDNDLNTTNEVLGIWNAIDGGANLTNPVSANGKNYNVARFEQDTENRVIYNGNFDGYSGSLAYSSINSNGPGGSGGSITGGNDFSVRAKSFLYFNTGGTYSIAVGSDDGRRIKLTATDLTAGSPFAGFTAAGGQTTGTNLGVDSSVVMHNNPTGHNHTTGVFTVAAGDILELDTFFYERGGGDQFHLSIKAGNDTSHGGTGDGWALLQNETLNMAVSSANNFAFNSNDTAKLDVKVTGVNDAPVISVVGGNSDSGALNETGSALLTGGTLSVQDIDTTDTVAFSKVSVLASGVTTGLSSNNATLLAMLNVSGSIDNSSTTGTLTWNFNSGAESFSYLSAGEVLTLTYTVQATDSQMVTEKHTVVVTVTGTGSGLSNPLVLAQSDAGTTNDFNTAREDFSFEIPPINFVGIDVIPPREVSLFRGNSLDFIASGSSLQFQQEFLSFDSLNVVSDIFIGGLTSDQEVAAPGNVEQDVKDKNVYDTPLLRTEELEFIKDLKQEEDNEDEDLSFDSTTEAARELSDVMNIQENVFNQDALDNMRPSQDVLLSDFESY
jgi:VCBS repeat-containing protein